ncbi:site-specific integrase [Varunaivibrio sulfuroxidans]|uniref:Site-specific recombinase XerD n=1 Tax=Varunaivibrio sulfuroxidans TaxID=1773489 RepID=A0A4R3JFN1_9PROT|nr:site-specific integrase [Varunaivibrio sulfuroxidans]TCS64684.1 site-specific recombinase XerD [Varunaivibrio sulfuroxidans]WES30009.1 phage integrase SAM-like domain-containing protein [Varunaivibrio sulfuroxidans]
MPKKHNLTKRGDVWYYRRRVPQGLEKAVGQSVVQFSLKTKDFKVAARMRDELDVEWNDRFDAAARQSDDPEQSRAALSHHEALRIVREYVRETDLKFQKQEVKRGPVPEGIQRDIEIDLGISEQTLADPSNEEGLLKVGDVSDKLLAQHNIELDLNDPFHDEFFEFMRRALLEVYRRAQARHNQDFSQSHYDTLFAPSASNGARATPLMPLSKVCDEYIEDYERMAETKNIRNKRRRDKRVGADLILEVMGKDTPIQDVTRKMCREFVDALSKLPPNRRKRFKKLPLAKVLAKAEKQGLSPMKWETQNSYLSTLNKVLDFARMEGYIDSNPAEGLMPLAISVPDEEKRDPFTLEQLQAIFNAPIYTGCVDDDRGLNKPGPNHPKRSRFWLPLISLFSGMRMNEVCQFNLDDLKCTEAGTHYFHVFPNTKDQRVKNKSSRRMFPVHPILIRIGLLDYIEDLRAKGETKAFPEIPVPKSGYRSDVFTKRFASFQKGVGIPRKVGTFPNERSYSFHSFRHNFRDELRRIEAPVEIIERLGGWTSGDTAVHKKYGKGHEADHLYKYVKRIGYPGLDLSHLYVKKK